MRPLPLLVLGPTNPNRLYMWTGMIDPHGVAGGPVTDNTPRVQQRHPVLDHLSGTPPAGRLPQVSWLVAPTAQSEHPDYFPAAGAEYVASKLDAIASSEDLWHKTLFIVTYDENDGLFDHVPPPVAPRGTPGEYVGGEPIGLGFRVPAVVVSPWSAGGRVCSDLLDHTSLIRVIEKRFGVREPNISAFRRRVCGDFTTALRFSGPPATNRSRPPARPEQCGLNAPRYSAGSGVRLPSLILKFLVDRYPCGGNT